MLFLVRVYSSGVRRIRNIGIIAHIDAGKTTTTERMLFYSGYTKSIGDVDRGSTVTDYLPQERERGITITSACIPFVWHNHRINLIDTPGHVDFTMEVERCVRVLDAGVVILDSVSGVEAQTETVWHQANKNGLPRIAFANKMDREGSSLSMTLESARKRLRHWGRPLVLQWPIVLSDSRKINGPGSGGPDLKGVVDLLSLQVLKFTGPNGESIERSSIDEFSQSLGPKELPFIESLKQECDTAREEIFSLLSEVDDEFLENLIEVDEDHSKLSLETVKAAIRRSTIGGKIVPFFVGAAYRNIGVQPLLDAIIDYLPSPAEVKPPKASVFEKSKNQQLIDVSISDKNLTALAFKIIQNKRGPLVFVRVYSGTLQAKNSLMNNTQEIIERPGKLFEMYADDFEEIPEIAAGNIGAVQGLKVTKTGDTLVNSRPKDPRGRVLLESIDIPPPVIKCTIGPSSQSDEKDFNIAITSLLREDPSLHLSEDEESGQKLLSGMGELHLEISLDRLRTYYKANFESGDPQVNYRETLDLGSDLISESIEYKVDMAGTTSFAKLTLEVKNIQDLSEVDTENYLNVPRNDLNGNEIQLMGGINGIKMDEKQGDYEAAIRAGILSSLAHGPIMNSPVCNLSITVKDCQGESGSSTPTAFRTAAFKAMSRLLQTNKESVCLLEPYMNVTIRVSEEYVGRVSRDINGVRRGNILSIESEEEGENTSSNSRIFATIPLKELFGYSSALRALTRGSGTFAMDLNGFGVISKDSLKTILEQIRGF